jgi:septal ring factor EnvC (AmiA/AmiB activator)
MKFLAAVGLTIPLLTTGCSQPRTAPKPATIVAMPEIAAEPKPAPEPTLLENYQESIKALEAQRVRCAGLQNDLEKERAERQTAQEENAKLLAKVAGLEQQTADLATLREKYEEAQQSALDLETEARNLRDELLQARLAGTRSEQALLAMKIEKAMEKRRRVLQTNQEGAEPNAPETELDNATSSVIP